MFQLKSTIFCNCIFLLSIIVFSLNVFANNLKFIIACRKVKIKINKNMNLLLNTCLFL